ncbi:MAG: phosphate ABC transporter permease subunit PstC [Pirellulaceae bacterium]|nr:phosphate ABC transporter permease subunit PstC [Pirellulaceae bacterium]
MNRRLPIPNALQSKRYRATGSARRSERVVVALLMTCALGTVALSVLIVLMLLWESWSFFSSEHVSMTQFLFGIRWTALEVREVDKVEFGIWPLLSGTLRVTGIAMLIAWPMGLITAIYLSEFASNRVRRILKPSLEILAGIPTVVFGYFAVLLISPGLQWFSPSFDTFNATSAGIAVGILCLPLVCSLAEDALSAVPTSLREAVYSLGGTRMNTALSVVVPSALSGVISAMLLAFSRALGETMVVALAAGTLATFTLDPRQQSQTMTGFIVEMLKSDLEYGTVQYYSLFGVALALFVITFGMTLLGQLIRRRYREVYQ